MWIARNEIENHILKPTSQREDHDLCRDIWFKIDPSQTFKMILASYLVGSLIWKKEHKHIASKVMKSMGTLWKLSGYQKNKEKKELGKKLALIIIHILGKKYDATFPFSVIPLFPCLFPFYCGLRCTGKLMKVKLRALHWLGPILNSRREA